MYFEKVYVLPKYPNSLFVQWSLNNSALPTDYLFNIYLSESPESGFEKINVTTIVNAYSYEFSKELLTKEEYLYIKIEAIVGDLNFWSNPQGLFCNLEQGQYLQLREIIRLKEMQRRVNEGTTCKVFKKIIWGPPCTQCISDHTGMVTDSKCLDCLGTGKINGYHVPIMSNVKITEAPHSIKVAEVGTTENRQAQGELTYPIVQKGDIIVEVQRNKRWYIGDVRRQELRGVPLDQIVGLMQISPKDVEYRLE